MVVSDSREARAVIEQLKGRLDAFREIHEHWELEESMTEAEFDQWLHDEMRRMKKELAGLADVLRSPVPAKVQWVKQEEPCGCALACLAMVTGQTYAQVRAAWPDHYNFETGGITNDDALHYLGDRGIRYHRRYRFVLGWNGIYQQKIRPGWPEVFAPVHIIGLGSGRHDVVLLADGTILDPQQEQPRRLKDIGEVAFMIGVWPAAGNEPGPLGAEQVQW